VIENTTLTHFLHKMTLSTGKGWILDLDFSDIDTALYEQKHPLIQSLLDDFQKNKILMILETAVSNHTFLYFREKQDIQTLLIKIQFVLGTSPTGKSQFEQKFYRVYQLNNKKDAQDLMHLLEQSVPTDTSNKFNTLLQKDLPQKKNDHPLTPAKLAEVEQTLSQADVSSLMHRQSVCIVLENARPVELFDEIYVSLSDLQKSLCPDTTLTGVPYLTDKVLAILDRRVLENVSHHDAGAFSKNFSMNMMVSTLLSADFSHFNACMESPFKSTVLLELGMADIFSDISSFLIAKEFALSEGYQLCIDSVSPDLLPFVECKKLGATYVKIPWCDDVGNKRNDPVFLTAIQKIGAEKIILNHVDDPKAIEWGQKLGIHLFEGFYVQKLLYQTPRQKKAQ